MRCTRTRMRSTECTYLESCLSARLSFLLRPALNTKHQNETKAEETRRDATGHGAKAGRRDAVESAARASQHGAVTAGRRRTGAVASRSWGLAGLSRCKSMGWSWNRHSGGTEDDEYTVCLLQSVSTRVGHSKSSPVQSSEDQADCERIRLCSVWVLVAVDEEV